MLASSSVEYGTTDAVGRRAPNTRQIYVGLAAFMSVLLIGAVMALLLIENVPAPTALVTLVKRPSTKPPMPVVDFDVNIARGKNGHTKFIIKHMQVLLPKKKKVVLPPAPPPCPSFPCNEVKWLKGAAKKKVNPKYWKDLKTAMSAADELAAEAKFGKKPRKQQKVSTNSPLMVKRPPDSPHPA